MFAAHRSHKEIEIYGLFRVWSVKYVTRVCMYMYIL